MLQTDKAKYTHFPGGYMGQLVEWPEVVTEGADLDECRAMLRDALNEMLLAYQDLGKEIPTGNALLEQLPVELDQGGQPAGTHHNLKGKHCETFERIYGYFHDNAHRIALVGPAGILPERRLSLRRGSRSGAANARTGRDVRIRRGTDSPRTE
jgi:predicted RNase H-like HicB family nuclease